jgi:hypothetical protein
MSVPGQIRKSDSVRVRSVDPSTVDMRPQHRQVHFVPNPEVAFHSITLSACATNPAGMSRPSSFAALRLMTSSQWVVTLNEWRLANYQPIQGIDPRAASGSTKKVGRNDPCPCGSGKKYKKCCGLN